MPKSNSRPEKPLPVFTRRANANSKYIYLEVAVRRDHLGEDVDLYHVYDLVLISETLALLLAATDGHPHFQPVQ